MPRLAAALRTFFAGFTGFAGLAGFTGFTGFAGFTGLAGLVGLAGMGLGLGCSQAGAFRCETREQCQDGERPGVCTDAGWCAFEDVTCESHLAYGELAPPELAGACVPVSVGTGTSSGPGGSSDATSSSSSEGPSITGDETGPVSQCAGGMGTPCEPADPCALAGMCDADGSCVPTGVISCNAPSGPCALPQGQCQPDGSCAYPPAPQNTECEDDDPCTVDDRCDAEGNCVPGPVCPSAGECQAGMCAPEGCVYAPVADGTSCGGAAADRCCQGTCVDISSDHEHCGGCNTACAAGQACESVEVTAECPDSPAATSGRCRCANVSDQCPLGQICRTQSPYTGRCTPDDSANCDGDFVEVQLCPNYCSY